MQPTNKKAREVPVLERASLRPWKDGRTLHTGTDRFKPVFRCQGLLGLFLGFRDPYCVGTRKAKHEAD